jgi:hypothetical protein
VNSGVASAVVAAVAPIAVMTRRRDGRSRFLAILSLPDIYLPQLYRQKVGAGNRGETAHERGQAILDAESATP